MSARPLTFPVLDAVPWLRHLVTPRTPALPLGGDMSFSTGASHPEAIIENRQHWLRHIDRSPDRAVMCGLVHGTTVRRVSAQDGGRGVLSPAETIVRTDGLITSEPGLTLMMCFADCVPLILVDVRRRIIGLGHAGWRGTLAGMAGSLVAAMRAECGAEPDAMIAVIGPSIGPRVYTVGPEVVTMFTEAYPGDELILSEHGETRLDLWAANVRQLTRAGIRPDAISCAGICTYEQGDRFFSHRYALAQKDPEGRFAVLITMEG
jgi:YfiH family protein